MGATCALALPGGERWPLASALGFLCKVKQRRVRLVLGWVTAWVLAVLAPYTVAVSLEVCLWWDVKEPTGPLVVTSSVVLWFFSVYPVCTFVWR